MDSESGKIVEEKKESLRCYKEERDGRYKEINTGLPLKTLYFPTINQE